MRYIVTGIAVGLAVAFLMSLHAVSHSLPVPTKKPWAKWAPEQRERYVRANLRHARYAIQWVKAHRHLYGGRGLASADRLLAEHRALRRKASRNLRALQDHIYFTGSWGERYRVVREIICSFNWSPSSCAGAVQVSRCETGGEFKAAPGDDPWSQFVGLFEMGDQERLEYGVGSYRTADRGQAGRAGAWDQVTSAWNMYVRNGRSWSRWACRPDGSTAY